MYRTIVTGSDGSDSSAIAVQSAAELVAAIGGHLHVVTVSDDPKSADEIGPLAGQMWTDPEQDSRNALSAAVRIADAAGANVSTHMPHGDPAAAIIRIATEVHADLIVVGNRGMRSASRFVGESVPGRLALHAPCSVLIVRTTS
jgi:nucleotide-binding universal stress UspA family protein